MISKLKRKPRQLYGLSWSRFSYQRTTCKAQRLRRQLEAGLVNLSIPGPCTLRQFVQALVNSILFPVGIESLCQELGNVVLPRGIGCFDFLGNLLDSITLNYPNMYWWITDAGLNIATIPSGKLLLSPMDELAGRLMTKAWKNSGLHEEALLSIAHELDNEGFSLKDELQPAQWKQIAEHNQKWSRKAITTFGEAVRNPRFVRHIRRRLYVARNKYSGTLAGNNRLCS
jgi:hypothetical protein